MYKFTVYIPVKYKEVVKLAMFEAGGGRVGNYDCCCFETIGTGQFRALEGANPYIGQTQKIENVEEVRIEMVVEATHIKDVVQAMKEAHPYETPAYDIIKMEEL